MPTLGRVTHRQGTTDAGNGEEWAESGLLQRRWWHVHFRRRSHLLVMWLPWTRFP